MCNLAVHLQNDDQNKFSMCTKFTAGVHRICSLDDANILSSKRIVEEIALIVHRCSLQECWNDGWSIARTNFTISIMQLEERRKVDFGG